jgi:hypothetical protein
MANFDRVSGPIDMRVWKGRRFENILKLDRDLRGLMLGLGLRLRLGLGLGLRLSYD